MTNSHVPSKEILSREEASKLLYMQYVLYNNVYKSNKYFIGGIQMTPEEYCLLGNHNYSFYTKKMGGVFCDWYDKKIDGTEAAQKLRKWYEKGLKKTKKEEHSDIKARELEECFNALDSFVRTYDLVDDDKESTPQNNLINEMIGEGILSKDGKTPLRKFDAVAFFLVEKGQFPTVASLKDMGLKKRDGKPYSDRAYQVALNNANFSKQRKKYA